MVRLFHVYYPVRQLVLLLGEALIVCASFLLATLLGFGQDSYLVLNYEGGFLKIAAVAGVALLCSHYFDLYDSQRLRSGGETYWRILIVLGSLSFLLAAAGYLFPQFMLGNNVFLMGLIILTLGLFSWRTAYAWMIQQPFFRERVYVMGGGERAQHLVDALRSRRDLGMDVVGWAGALGNGSLTREALAKSLQGLRQQHPVDRVILAMSDRRGSMPVAELLDLRLSGWAQINYHYGASLDEAKEKLRYDLYYIKNLSLTLDLLIVFQTVKTFLLRRGGQ